MNFYTIKSAFFYPYLHKKSMLLNHHTIKNIIFDFGGVIINLHYSLTLEKLKNLGINDFEKHFTQYSQSGLFDKLDKGLISGEDFFTELAMLYPVKPAKSALTDAWNAMLLDFPQERADLLRNLKTRYRTFLLSNTNEIHLDYFFGKLNEWYGVGNMSSFVHKEYYSNRIHMRKPDIEIFKHVIDENNLVPEETLFIDDTLQHIEGAKKAGLNAYHLVPPETITELFSSWV